MSRTYTLDATVSGHTFVILGKILNEETNLVEDYFKLYQARDESQEAFVERARQRAINRMAELGAREEELSALTRQIDELKGKVQAACPTSTKL